MSVKWWYPAKFQPFQSRWVFVQNPSYLEGGGLVCTRSASSFCRNLLNFCTHAMWAKWWYHAKFQPFQRRWVFVRIPHTSKEMVQFVHEMHPILPVILSTFKNVLCVCNDDTMPIFNLFGVHLYSFSISGSFSANKSLNAWKIANEDRKGWNLRMWL